MCKAPARVGGGLVDHWWIKIGNIERGMGGNVENPGDEFESPYITDVVVRDHSRQSQTRDGASCSTVSGVCVNKVEEALEVNRSLGKFNLLLNNCQTFCLGVINSSRSPNFIEQRRIEVNDAAKRVNDMLPSMNSF